MTPDPPGPCPSQRGPMCLSRRQMLLASSAGAMTVLLGELFPGRVFAQDAGRSVTFAPYPRKRIARLSELKPDTPVPFRYPGEEELYSGCLLTKLGRRAGGGVGPDEDVVAFSAYCVHMGAALYGAYDAEYKVAGPCPQHLTTFDLTRHGLVVAGHATESLPQIVLEVEGDEIHATGVVGLIYGHYDNRAMLPG